MIDKPIKDLTPEEREQVIQELKETATPEEWASLTQIATWLSDAGQWVQDHKGEITGTIAALEAVRDFMPVFADELSKDSEAASMNPHQLIESGKYDEIVERARQRLESTTALPTYTAHKLNRLDFPLDKVNSNVWKLLEASDANGQLTMNFSAEKAGSTQQLDIMYGIDFNDLTDVTITKKLDAYDKRVYIAIAGLYKAGYDVISYQQIYNNMGYTGRAGGTDLKKIDASVTKMFSARILLNNEIETQHYDYPTFKYDGSLLPMERITARCKGQIADGAIHIFRYPPLMAFAEGRKQITPITVRLLNSPLNKTAANMELEDYLIEQIARIKNGKRNNKMLYSTIYEQTHITTKKQRQRAPEKIKKLLAHYKEQGFIKGYKTAQDSITIVCEK